MFAEDISEDFSQKIEDITFTGFYSMSGYLRNLRGRLLSSENFSEVGFLPLSRFQQIQEFAPSRHETNTSD